jgi:hypothetical protein
MIEPIVRRGLIAASYVFALALLDPVWTLKNMGETAFLVALAAWPVFVCAIYVRYRDRLPWIAPQLAVLATLFLFFANQQNCAQEMRWCIPGY